MDSIINLLQFLGFTPDQYPFLVLGVFILAGFVYMRISMGKQLEPINTKLGKVKDNVVVIITHLSATASARGRLDTNLIQVMSPMVLTDQGRQVLNDSGFVDIVESPACRAEVLSYLDRQLPNTRLDVENQAILSVSALLEKDFMNPVKVYLYNNPNIRETFVTLAGIYIRDEYLKDHPEIAA
jgi:hypothetical protein